MSDIVNEVLAARYFREGESSWEDVCRRVADYVGNTDDEREIYYDMMVNKDFVPNSPTLMNAGTEIGQLSACFVIPVNDSMESIFDAIKNAALIHKAAGGTGFSFGNLRPEGDKVNGTDGVASGPISFMKVFNAATGAVVQGSKRRGANMGVLPVWHPDIEKFIACKNTEGDLSNFNISVMIDDEFISAVKNDKEYNLHFDGKVYKTIRAKEVFDKIVDGISKTGEPGVLFYNTINDDNTCKHLGNIEATNPCLVGETLILTNEGYKRIDECVDKETTIWNGFEWSVVTPCVTGYDQEVMEVTFSDGNKVKCTPYHKFVLQYGYKGNKNKIVKKEAKDLVVGDKLIKCDYPVIEGKKELEFAYTHGFFSGDGYKCQSNGIKYIYLYGIKKDLVEYLNAKRVNYNQSDDHDRILVTLQGDYEKLFVPNCSYTIKSRLEWLAGIVDSDGCKNTSEGSIAISSVKRDFLMDVKYMLDTLGINTSVNLMKKSDYKLMPDGNGGQKEYYCLDCYRLTIPASNVKKLVDLGFKTYRVPTVTTNKRDAKRFIKIVSIERNNEIVDKVYCFNEPKNHTGIFNGILASNCGEQPLLPGESCNLGSINLSNFVNNNGLMQNDLINTIELSTEFLDKIIDLNKYPIEEIAEASRKTRKIGLGYMGFHHMLMKMGIPYDSSDALYQAKKVMGILNDMSVLTSRELAKELGVFPAYEGSDWFLHDIPIRNATTTCIAPTGSIATLSETSYGIEPVYSLVHKRYTWVDGKKKGYLMVDPVFEEKLNNYIESHVEVSQWDKKKQEVINHAYETGTIQDITWLPKEFKSVFKTALDIDWKSHIDMQAAFQQYCHAAISKTINMPPGATKDDIRSAILYAYEKGCKGVTIYVTGSRDDIVMELKKDSTPTTPLPDGRILPKRPSDLPATNSKRRSGCGKLIISVAEKDGKPYECIINNKGGCTAMNDALGQMISLSMRWNVPTWDIIKTLRNVTCPVAYKKFSEGNCDGKSCSDVIGRVIESLIPDKESEPISIPCKEEIKTESNICPECGEHLSMVEGCKTCACGYSRCG
jgi:ribonucleoside-diphosphate reductase alpha chain